MPRPIDALVDRTPLRHGEELRVTLGAFRGQQYFHARRYFEEAGVWRPGKGLAVRIDMLPWLRNALRIAEEDAVEAGLLRPEDDRDASPKA